MDKRQNMILLLIIATLVAQIEHYETTRRINKLRRQIRLGLNKYIRCNSEEYTGYLRDATSIWESAKSEVDENGFTVSLSLALVICYDLLDDKHKQLWFTAKTFEAAVSSLEHGYELDATTEASSKWLIDKFTDELGISKTESPLAKRIRSIKAKVC